MSVSSRRIGAGTIAQLACVLEATARKPGNVHRFRDFDDVHYLDFILSASAIAGPLDRASDPDIGLGRTIFEAIQATRSLIATNTNLGIVLLLAPLAAVPIGIDLRAGVKSVLRSTSSLDASEVYRAIRLAMPGGLGSVEDQDIAHEPTVTLRESMILAADRDLVARQYAEDYAGVFDQALPTLQDAVESGRSIESAIIVTFLGFLVDHPDTLIARKRGDGIAQDASRWARNVLELGWPDAPEGVKAMGEFDAWLRADGHARNPGATADLMTAALFAAIRDGTIEWPIAGRWSRDAGLVE